MFNSSHRTTKNKHKSPKSGLNLWQPKRNEKKKTCNNNKKINKAENDPTFKTRKKIKRFVNTKNM